MKRLLIVSALTLAFVVMWGQTGTAQMGDWGTISGTVTIQDSDQPLEHANVKAYAVDGYNWPVGLALSDESGNYEMNVPYGEYVVVADKWQYLPEWWQEVEHREDATSVTVGEDNNPTGIDFTLAEVSSQFGSISGMADIWICCTGGGPLHPTKNANVTRLIHLSRRPLCINSQ